MVALLEFPVDGTTLLVEIASSDGRAIAVGAGDQPVKNLEKSLDESLGALKGFAAMLKKTLEQTGAKSAG